MRLLLPALAVLLAACGATSITDVPGPTDRFYFPAGIAVRGAPGSEQLLVVSTNFDLFYSRTDGGSVLSVAPALSPQGGAQVDGAARVPAFGGEIAVAEAGCGSPALAGPLALVAVRDAGELRAYTLGAGGALQCAGPTSSAPGCVQPITAAQDPYGVAVACAPGRPPRAFVTHLRSLNGRAWLTEVNLADGTQRSADIGLGPTQSAVYDPGVDRVYVTGGEGGLTSVLRYVDTTPGCDSPLGLQYCHTDLFDVGGLIRGIDLRSIALSNPNVDAAGQPVLRRLYLSGRLYDADLASSLGYRPAYDTGGLLVTLEVEEGPYGYPVFRYLGAVSIGFGAGQVRVLPARPGKRDVVAVTASDDGLLWLYDDEVGAVARVIGRDPATGKPVLGRSPFGLAVQDLGTGTARVYVAAFDSSYVTPVDVPLDDPGRAAVVTIADPADPTRQVPRRIGEERQ